MSDSEIICATTGKECIFATKCSRCGVPALLLTLSNKDVKGAENE